ncbi:MAG: hypothetical protein AAF402_10640 [Pseudomonadota bacterium]
MIAIVIVQPWLIVFKALLVMVLIGSMMSYSFLHANADSPAMVSLSQSGRATVLIDRQNRIQRVSDSFVLRGWLAGSFAILTLEDESQRHVCLATRDDNVGHWHQLRLYLCSVDDQT